MLDSSPSQPPPSEFVALCHERSRAAGVSHLADFKLADFSQIRVDVDYIQSSTVIYLFLLPRALQVISPLLGHCLAQGKKVVTFQYHLDAFGFKSKAEDLMGMIRMY